MLMRKYTKRLSQIDMNFHGLCKNCAIFGDFDRSILKNSLGCVEMKKAARSYETVEELYRKAQPTYAHAGGFIPEEEEDDVKSKKLKSNTNFDDVDDLLNGAGGFFDDDNDADLVCDDCQKPFITSFLHKTFLHPVCDSCKNINERHVLITRTEAKNEYLLKDCDLDLRSPTLMFISKKNPHNPRWGDMKLYLKLQVEKRAVDVWGSFESLEEAKEKREENKESMKQKRFQKKIKELRKQVRSDLYRKPPAAHQHDYDDEQQDEEQGEGFYFKLCKTCQHKISYEKL